MAERRSRRARRMVVWVLTVFGVLRWVVAMPSDGSTGGG